MRRLVDKVERAMFEVNPFGYMHHDGGHYYYEANNMMKLLPHFKVGDSVLDLCMDAFQIHNDGQLWWKWIAETIEPLILQHKSKVRTSILKEELMQKVFHPDRVEKWVEQGYDLY